MNRVELSVGDILDAKFVLSQINVVGKLGHIYYNGKRRFGLRGLMGHDRGRIIIFDSYTIIYNLYDDLCLCDCLNLTRLVADGIIMELYPDSIVKNGNDFVINSNSFRYRTELELSRELKLRLKQEFSFIVIKYSAVNFPNVYGG